MRIAILKMMKATDHRADRRNEETTKGNACKKVEDVIIIMMETETSVQKFQQMDLADAMMILRANGQIYRRTNAVTRPCLLHIH
jgi:hypothetical protein